ncbi:hypothetical protein H0E87_025275 [Populus deltoides]|uniref:Longin domain-containing protein n=1 Tax=Populus deltoides TaxID=3696 RepID=A0A8T2WXV2_POPDE|nr:hypothetical protein H0E87_025275 [Populus deltoides]
MSQKSLIYAFVSRGTVILADYTEFSGNFNSIAFQCLQKLPATNNKFTYNCDGHTFNYLVDNGFTYCVVAAESAGRQVPIAFLERVKDDFVTKYGGGKAATAQANGLNKEFGPKLKEHMQYCADHPEEISKLAKVKAQVSEVKGVMMENIEKILSGVFVNVPFECVDMYVLLSISSLRFMFKWDGIPIFWCTDYEIQLTPFGINVFTSFTVEIELHLVPLTHGVFKAQDFRSQGTQIRRKMWLQNMKVKLIVLGILIVLILIIVLSICKGFNC